MLLNLSELSAPIQIEALFGERRPLEIEIGVGKGRFLRERASAVPQHAFLGLEKSRKWIRVAEEKLKKAGLSHVHLVQCYVEGFLEQYVPDVAVHQYHILFPDPWPKKRHLKRRLIQERFLREIYRTLEWGGSLNVATDYKSYFDHISKELTALSRDYFVFERVEPGPVMTNFQVKYMNEGRPLYFARATKMTPTDPKSDTSKEEKSDPFRPFPRHAADTKIEMPPS
jgi:tRNA (guanine-N7-)-methyltransferase